MIDMIPFLVWRWLDGGNWRGKLERERKLERKLGPHKGTETGGTETGATQARCIAGKDWERLGGKDWGHTKGKIGRGKIGGGKIGKSRWQDWGHTNEFKSRGKDWGHTKG